MAATALVPATASAALGDRTLQQGAEGRDVRVLQDFLTRAGFTTPVVGTFGPQTEGNVKRFQRSVGITADGVVTAAVAQALRRAAGRPEPTAQRALKPGRNLGGRELRVGMRGQDVRVLQDYLTRAGIATAVDGAFGKGTARNVKRFQRAQGLPVTGVVTAEVVEALRRVGDGVSSRSLGAAGADQELSAPVGRAKLLADGTAIAPADAPAEVKAIIAAGNEIASKPYVYGGGHRTWVDRGYDCSGSISYALHGANLLKSPLDSSSFMSWGDAGPGQWVTIYTNPGHAYMVVAGLRFDTSGANPSRWQSDMRSSSGFKVRHPAGL